MSYPEDPETYETDELLDQADEARKREKGE